MPLFPRFCVFLSIDFVFSLVFFCCVICNADSVILRIFFLRVWFPGKFWKMAENICISILFRMLDVKNSLLTISKSRAWLNLVEVSVISIPYEREIVVLVSISFILMCFIGIGTEN